MLVGLVGRDTQRATLLPLLKTVTFARPVFFPFFVVNSDLDALNRETFHHYAVRLIKQWFEFHKAPAILTLGILSRLSVPSASVIRRKETSPSSIGTWTPRPGKTSHVAAQRSGHVAAAGLPDLVIHRPRRPGVRRCPAVQDCSNGIQCTNLI